MRINNWLALTVVILCLVFLWVGEENVSSAIDTVFLDPVFLQSFFPDLMATIVGVALGIPVAYGINRRIEDITSREKKTKILAILERELKSNRAVLQRWIQKKDESSSSEMYGAKLDVEMWESFSDGGELQWIREVGTLSFLAMAYSHIRRIKYLYEAYLHWQSLAGQPKDVINEDLWVAINNAVFMIDECIHMIENDKVIADT